MLKPKKGQIIRNFIGPNKDELYGVHTIIFGGFIKKGFDLFRAFITRSTLKCIHVLIRVQWTMFFSTVDTTDRNLRTYAKIPTPCNDLKILNKISQQDRVESQYILYQKAWPWRHHLLRNAYDSVEYYTFPSVTVFQIFIFNESFEVCENRLDIDRQNFEMIFEYLS